MSNGKGAQKRAAKEQKRLLRDQRAALQREQEKAIREQQETLTSMAAGLRGRQRLLSAGYAGFAVDDEEENKRTLGA